ncbi:MAG: ATP-binding cassette domain-containing protein [Acidimicrobiia bacterium]|nr:ATP-binding cassette domain-containing protein [Acidimicrobiia bacterium]
MQIRDVSKRFGSHQVLEGISFDIPRGAVTNIMGPSGTGKSVLLKNIIGLLKPEEGSIWIDGQDLVQLSDRELYKVRMKMGVLFQDGALFGSMNLFDNIAFPMREHTKRTEKDIHDTVMEKADLVGLVAHLRKFPGEISGGMKKRAGLARALVLEPEIVLFDEPDSGLDPVRVAYLDDLILKTKAETNATFVVITHNIESTTRVADYMAILFRSRLAAFGSRPELFASDDPVVRQFLHGETHGPIGMDELADAEEEIERTLQQAQAEQAEREYALAGVGAAGAAGAAGMGPDVQSAAADEIPDPWAARDTQQVPVVVPPAASAPNPPVPPTPPQPPAPPW